LDEEKLGDLLELKYHSVGDGAQELGGVGAIRETFIGFQKYLYE
jgi:type I restriction enzyme R subunit